MLIAPLSAASLSAAADRHGDRAIAALSFMSGLSVVLFFALALLMAPAARAAEASPASCGGVNLAETLTDKNMLAEIEAAVAAKPNNKGLLWRISKEGLADSHLFGTMHVTDPRVLTLPAKAQAAFDAAGKLVIETTDVLDQQAAQAAMMQRPDLMMFTDGNALDTLIPAEERPMVEEKLAARGMPLASVRLMKPWMIASLLATPACELNRKGDVEILDIDLARRADASGKFVHGLETMVEQVEAMASLPMKDHIDGLVETLRMDDKMDDVFETMVALYTQGETARLMPVISAAFAVDLDPAKAEQQAEAYAAFEEKMINARNRVMAERLPPHLADGGVFVAVGALHLPGEKGLIEELRRAGYTVTAAD